MFRHSGVYAAFCGVTHHKEKGTELRFTQEALGHASSKTTGIYPVGIHYHIRQGLKYPIFSIGVNTRVSRINIHPVGLNSINMYYYVYVLRSSIDKMLYTGYTSNLKQRIQNHNEGKVPSTRNRKPLELIYFEGCLNQQDATRREKYLKSGNGKIYLRNRLKNYFNPTG